MVNCWFDYKTVVVTGASSGIGKGIVKKLIDEHCCNVIGVARNKEKMEAFVRELGDKARYFSYYLFDVSVNENWENFVKELTEKKIQPTLLINNAGILPKFDRFSNYSIEYIDHAMEINFYSCIYSMHHMLPLLLKSSTPAIVNISSSAALCALAGTSVYSASKAALKSFTESIREEYRGKCYFGLVCPGFTKTDIFSNQGKINDRSSEKALQLVSSSCDKMVNKIVEGIWKKKANMIFGIDAKLMHHGNKIMGVHVSKISSLVIKKSGLELFASVFSEQGWEDLD